MTELPYGIRRLTFELPLGIRHVHCYLLPGADGWTLVDTGLGLPDAEGRWEPVLTGLGEPVGRIVITHFHPDHAGGGADAEALTGAGVLQGAEDYAQCERVWGRTDWSERLAGYLRENGLPEPLAEELRDESQTLAPFIRFARDPGLLHEGGEGLDASGRRFALAETLAHLERLVREGRAARSRSAGSVAYTEP